MAADSRGRRLVAESSVIVFSILLAFAIDAAWNSRREREEEVRFLSAIDAEITLNLERIEGARAFRTAKRASALALLELSAQPEVDARRVDALIADLTWWSVGRWQTSAVDTLLTGGKLALVEDQVLRQQLVTLPGAIRGLVQNEAQDEQTFRRLLIPQLIRKASLAQIANATVDYPPGLFLDRPARKEVDAGKLPVAGTKDHRELLRSAEFLGVVTETYWEQSDVLYALHRTKQQLAGVQVAIRAELGETSPAVAEEQP